MKLRQTPIEGLAVAESTPHVDERGSFMRLFCGTELQDVFGTRQIAQINHSRTQAVGAVRGLHYQLAPHAEMKLVRCTRGRVFDVAVDLRAGSATFLKWHAEELTAANSKMMIIPEGCAHGFQVLEEDSELLYLHTASYTPAAEDGVRPTDPTLAIDWPLAIAEISSRDRGLPLLTGEFKGLVV